MKILICTGIYPPDIGGPATYTKLICEELGARGDNLKVLTYGQANADSPISAVKYPIFFVSRNNLPVIRHFLYFLRVLELGKDADILYVQDPVSVGLPAVLANIFLKKKLILKIVGDYAWEQAMQISNFKFQISNLDSFYPFGKIEYPIKIRLLKKIQTWVAGKADKIITPSFYLKNILINGWKINENKIKVIYNSSDIPSFVIPSEGEARVEESHPFKIISVGRLVPWKGFGTLIDAVKDIPNAELEIVGDGPEYKNYELRILPAGRQVTNCELRDKIKLLGRLSHNEVVQKMYSSDLFILNSAYEGLSHVILEAMACGLPVAVSRAGGNPELVGENEERGYLFEYNIQEQIKEKINHIMAHPEEVKEKAKKASAFGGSFSKEKMISELEKELKNNH